MLNKYEHLNCEWNINKKDTQIKVYIILQQCQTNLLSKVIIINQTKHPLLICKETWFNKQMQNNTGAHELRTFNLLIEPTNN